MANIFKLREALATQVIKQFEYDYMLWIDSDQTFNRNDFFNLLSADKDIASGCYRIINGNYCFGYFDQEPRVNVNEITQKECFEVDFVGFGFMLIKKGVFEKLGTPYFNPIYDKKYEDFMGEDESFCVKARNAGFKIFCKPDVKIGHEKQLIL